jgi:hypothetical protein
MKMNLAALALLLACLPAAAPAQNSADDAAKLIEGAARVILDPAVAGDQIKGAIIQCLDAAILALPRSGQAAGPRSSLTAARMEMKERSIFSEKAMQQLSLAYRALNDGKNFQMPKLGSIENARIHIRELLANAVVELKKGKGETASRMVVESVLMTVTPMER